jgi:hypothetical protein
MTNQSQPPLTDKRLEEAPERIWIVQFTDSGEVTCSWYRDATIRTTQPGDYVAVRPHQKIEYVRADLLQQPTNERLSSEVAQKIAARIKGTNSDYWSTSEGLVEIESIVSHHFAAAALSASRQPATSERCGEMQWTPEQIACLKDFEREMKENVIPEIEKALQERAIPAEQARRGWPLFTSAADVIAEMEAAIEDPLTPEGVKGCYQRAIDVIAATGPGEEAQREPLCPVHKRIDDNGTLELEIGNNCVACSLNERTELLKVLEPVASPDGSEDSVTVLRRAIGFYQTHVGENRVVVPYPAAATPATPSAAGARSECCNAQVTFAYDGPICTACGKWAVTQPAHAEPPSGDTQFQDSKSSGPKDQSGSIDTPTG